MRHVRVPAFFGRLFLAMFCLVALAFTQALYGQDAPAAPGLGPASSPVAAAAAPGRQLNGHVVETGWKNQ